MIGVWQATERTSIPGGQWHEVGEETTTSDAERL